LVIADYFVIISARNTRHAHALSREIEFQLKKRGHRRRNAAGAEQDSPWVLLDFDEVVVHVFVAETRAFYDLEGLWADAPAVPFAPALQPARAERRALGHLPDSIGRS
jgi:ribosome-associated protein